jgi:predicted phosphodiesterase
MGYNIMKKVLKIWFYSIVLSAMLISSAQAFKFAVISDTRAGSLDNALEFIVSQQVGFIVLPGDFYYDEQDYYSHFVKFGFEVMPDKQPDRQNVYFVIGNHDAPPFGDNSFVASIAPYYPDNGPEIAPRGTVFSFDRENCHFVITNQYWDDPKGGYTDDQLDWIKQDLAASDQTFKFVFGHEPAFPIDRHVGDSLDADPAQRDWFWDILADNGVQAFFCGHTHNLSHILQNGIYQIDNGEVRNPPLCVTIVDVTAEKAMIKSYKTGGSVPKPEIDSEKKGSLVIQTDITLNESPLASDEVEVLFSAGPVEDGFFAESCFIQMCRGYSRCF